MTIQFDVMDSVNRRLPAGGLLFILLYLVLEIQSSYAGNWSLSGSFQYSSGDYTTESNISSYYLTAGVGYQIGRLTVLASIPYIRQNSTLVSRNGGIMMPSGQIGGSAKGDGRPGSPHGGMMQSEIVTDDDYIDGLGDTYLFSSLRIVNEKNIRPSVSLTGQMKIPTATSDLGTGKADFGSSIGVFKQINLYSLFADAGIWFIGDTDSIHYMNPFTLGTGAGRIFSGGKYSAMFYFQTYTSTIEGFEAPRQISLSISRFLNQKIFISISGTAGLSETSSDFILSTGIYTIL